MHLSRLFHVPDFGFSRKEIDDILDAHLAQVRVAQEALDMSTRAAIEGDGDDRHR